jgi:tRNA U34 5-methylaminomethyl-2-thiouridine-forming methyltransferase MnmC
VHLFTAISRIFVVYFKDMNLELLTTEDGSSTLYNAALDETYHNRKGAWTESEYVYISAGLATCAAADLQILEFGFGTGMNALLSLKFASAARKNISYISAERFPLPEAITQQIQLPDQEKRAEAFNTIHRCSWNEWNRLFPFFSLYKHHGDFISSPCPESSTDVIFYDAFAPSRQPDAWEITQLEFAKAALKKGGILVSYCAQGQFKRNLRALGFDLEKLPGALGKGEMTRATKL